MPSSPNVTFRSHTHSPFLFEEFFEMGKEEELSPFLTPESRKWASHLTVKASLLAALLLFFSFLLSFFPGWMPLSHFFLVCVYFFAGIPALIESIEDLASFIINIDILMTLAAFSSVFIGSGMEGGLLLVLFALSGSMEDAVTTRAKGSLRALHKLSPSVAYVITDEGEIMERSVKDVVPTMKVLVKSGEVVPLDGQVVEGISTVNMAHLTGESLPITKKPGDRVAAGSRNGEGALHVVVTHTSADSTLARIIQLVTRAQEARPKLQRWFDSWSRTYASSIILFSFAFALLYPLFGTVPYLGLEGSIYRALAFLIAASPCALIIAVPIAYLSAVSVCAREGFLIKGGVTLDAVASCRAVAFDKTGTLTTGDLQCMGIVPLETDRSPTFALSVAYSLEQNAVHPIAKGILDFARKREATTLPLTSFTTLPGYGLSGSLETGEKVFLGNLEGVEGRLPKKIFETIPARIAPFRDAGEMIALLVIDTDVFLFRFVDTIRPHTAEVVERLKKNHHLRLFMLTGDHPPNAERIAKEVGISEYYADLRPEEKLRYVEKATQEIGLAMVGDGINDAPALARATVGISMGKQGSMAAADAADVVLLHDKIEKLDWLFTKAHHTKAIVTQNLAVASGAILIAAFPALAGIVPLWLAVILHEGGTLLVGLNALRLLRR